MQEKAGQTQPGLKEEDAADATAVLPIISSASEVIWHTCAIQIRLLLFFIYFLYPR